MKQLPCDNTTARKCLRILMAFSPVNKEFGTMELSRTLELNKSTVSKLLSVLKETYFIQQNPDNKKYSLGPAVAELGQARSNSANNHFVEIAKPFLDQIRDELKHTATLTLPLSHAIVQAYVAEGLTPIRWVSFPGKTNPYHTTSGGKVLLAFGSPEVRKRILSSELKKVTQFATTDSAVLNKKLQKIRHDGFCFSCKENNVTVNSFAVPVFDHENVAMAAIVIAGSTQVVLEDQGAIYVPVFKGRCGSNICSLECPEERTFKTGELIISGWNF